MKTVSIIIPVFNLHDKIGRLLENVLSQTYSDLQVIVVDDGSTDDSADICRSFAERDNRITLINKENGGVSSARNAGLDYATGDYIMFVDGDDGISEDYVEAYVSQAENSMADIVIGGFRKIEDSKSSDNMPKTGIYSRKEFFSLLCREGTLLFGYVCNKLISKQLFEKVSLRFREDMHSQEDLNFFLSAYSHADVICCIDNCGYTYYFSPSQRVLPAKHLLGNQIKLYQSALEAGADTEPQILRFQKLLYTVLYHSKSCEQMVELAGLEGIRALLAPSELPRREVRMIVRLFREQRYSLVLRYFRARNMAGSIIHILQGKNK